MSLVLVQEQASVSEGDLQLLHQRLANAGLQLPSPPKAVGDYMLAQKMGGLLSISGQLPVHEGKLLFEGLVGKQVNQEQAVAAAERAVLNALSVANETLGNDLCDVIGCFRMSCFVATTPDFNAIPIVANGASRMLVTALGDIGRCSRSAIGVASLPMNAPVEIELTLQLKETLS